MLHHLGDIVRQKIDGGDQKVTAAHGRIEHLEVQYRLGGVQPPQLAVALGPGPGVAGQRNRLLRESRQPLFRQGLQGPVHNQIDQLLRREEAPAVLAGIAVGARDDVAIVVPNRLTLQQTLVDGSQLLDRHIPIVDEAPSLGGLGVAQVVNYRGKCRIGQADAGQQRCGRVVEQAAVVGRQADGRVALVDELAQRHQVIVVVRGSRRERGATRHPAGDVVPDRFPQAVVLIPRVVDGKQAPVFGVKHKEQPIEEDEGRRPKFRKFLLGVLRQRLNQPRKGTLKDNVGKVLGHLLFVTPSLRQRRFQEADRGALLRFE